MAAIIAQLTRTARKRQTRKSYGANKCLYSLQPFSPNGFDPAVHNKYLYEKTRWAEHLRRKEEEEEEIRRLWREHQRNITLSKKPKKGVAPCLLESALLCFLLSVIPASLLIIELFFIYGTLRIAPEILETLW